MRRFHSYGPVDCDEHFCVPRMDMIDRCAAQLVGNPEKGGHFFTIWSPRQCGKTWLMRQAADRIAREHPDRFIIAMMSMQGVSLKTDAPEEIVLGSLPLLFWEAFKVELPDPPTTFDAFKNLFLRDKGLFSRPVILFIDEFDSLPPQVIDRLVTLFRDMYLKRDGYLLHGLALIGVRAVLGVDSQRGSPFNIQRSLHVPNFTPEEVTDLFDQYQTESGQRIEPDVVRSVFEVTRGQPGLVGWFGELLTETYNPGPETAIGLGTWKRVYGRACHSEWNNTVLNLLKKVRAGYQTQVMALFNQSDIVFSIDVDWCAYLYLNGVIDRQEAVDARGEYTEVCRFANPFIQLRVYNALTRDMLGDDLPILALDPLDDLADVFDTAEIDLPALLERYKAYLTRLKARGLNPWQDQPRRSDLRYTEAVGHFHLYFWLQNAVGRLCGVSPEFPTGNGRVDLHLRCKDRRAVIEVKSFRDQAELRHSRDQAANYARRLGLPTITLALFAPLDDEAILAKLSGTFEQDGITLHVVAIGWV
jgi:hypothetical protein